jgi:hypothetical protein
MLEMRADILHPPVTKLAARAARTSSRAVFNSLPRIIKAHHHREREGDGN